MQASEKPIYQQIVRVSGTLQPSKTHIEARGAESIILNWLDRKKGIFVPWDQVLKGRGFSAKGKLRGASVEVIEQDHLWAMKFEHPDPLGRRWRNEVVIEKLDGGSTH